VLLGSLGSLAATHPTLLQPYYNSLASNGDSTVQFNTAFAQDGVLLYIPRNTVIEETIQIVSLIHANVDIMLNRRLLIIAGENSQANILLCDHSSHEKQSLSTQVTEIFVEQGAKLNLYELEETAPTNTRVASLFVQQMSDSSFNHCNVTLTNGFTRNTVAVSLEGSGAHTSINGLAIGDKEQHIDNRTLVDHKTGRCTSNELYKYILDEESTGVFAGKMLIREGAQHTVSEQTNRNLCLTSCAHMYAQPQLEIYADDVKCSHGSTVGQLDENAMFYMQQRGIPAKEARHLLMYAFAGEVIEKIEIEALRDRLHMLVEKRFRGELNKCKGCNICK
jgi:Fe-S cluster assembly protein SufD